MTKIKGTWSVSTQDILDLVFQVGDRTYRRGLNGVTGIVRAQASSGEVVFRHTEETGRFRLLWFAEQQWHERRCDFRAERKRTGFDHRRPASSQS